MIKQKANESDDNVAIDMKSWKIETSSWSDMKNWMKIENPIPEEKIYKHYYD